MFYGSVEQYAPTREKYASALEKCRFRLELFVLVFCVLMVRSAPEIVGDRLEGNLAWVDWWWNSSSLVFGRWLGDSWMGGWRIALGAFFLSWMVVMRFIGRVGIAQCSPVPLPSNPFQILKTPDAILDSLVGPNPNPPATQKSGAVSHTGTLPNKRIRYNKPHLTTIAMQMMFHALGGYFYFKSVTATIGDNISDQTTTARITMICCILISNATLITSYVIKTCKILPHELSTQSTTQKYPSSRYLQVQEEFMMKLGQSKMLFVWLFTPILVSMVMLAQTGKETGYVDFFLPIKDVAQVLIFSTYPKTLFLIIYTVILDITVRMNLVMKGVDIDRLLRTKKKNRFNNENEINEELNAEDLIVQSILGGFGTAIVEEIVAPHSPAVGNVNPPQARPLGGGLLSGGVFRESVFLSGGSPVMDLEAEEMRRYGVSMGYVADAIEAGLVSGCTSFEDNLLRMLILESLGGSTGGAGGSDDLSTSRREKKGEPEENCDNGILKEENHLLPVGLSMHHHLTLKRLRCGSTVVPVVRALCVYAGGLGESLKRCTAKSISDTNVTWSCPPCALESGEYAIVGAARLVALTILDRSGGNTRRNHNCISPLILVVLQSAHRLRHGLLDYSKYLMRFEGFYETPTVAGTNNLSKTILLRFPDISHAIMSCDRAAIHLMQVINSNSIANVSGDCDAWLKTLQ